MPVDYPSAGSAGSEVFVSHGLKVPRPGQTGGVDGWTLVIDERRALVELLRTFEPDEWRVPSLCPGWTAHDVLAHLVSVLEARPGDMARAAALGLGVPSRITVALARRWAGRTHDQLVDDLQKNVDSRFAPPLLGYRRAHRCHGPPARHRSPGRPRGEPSTRVVASRAGFHDQRHTNGWLHSGRPSSGHVHNHRPSLVRWQWP